MTYGISEWYNYTTMAEKRQDGFQLLSISDAADALGISENAVRLLLHRGRLRRALVAGAYVRSDDVARIKEQRSEAEESR